MVKPRNATGPKTFLVFWPVALVKRQEPQQFPFISWDQTTSFSSLILKHPAERNDESWNGNIFQRNQWSQSIYHHLPATEFQRIQWLRKNKAARCSSFFGLTNLLSCDAVINHFNQGEEYIQRVGIYSANTSLILCRLMFQPIKGHLVPKRMITCVHAYWRMNHQTYHQPTIYIHFLGFWRTLIAYISADLHQFRSRLASYSKGNKHVQFQLTTFIQLFSLENLNATHSHINYRTSFAIV